MLTATRTYQCVSITALPKITAALQQQGIQKIGVDLETTGLLHDIDKIVTLQYGTQKRQFILDCRPFYSATKQEKQQWKQYISDLLVACEIVGHNLKFDLKFIKYHFGVLPTRLVDTMLDELVLHGIGQGRAEGNGLSVSMEATGERYKLPVTKDMQKWSVGLDKKPEWYTPFPDDFLAYCAQDVRVPLAIHAQQTTILKQRDLLPTVTLEHVAIPAVVRLELDGMYVDVDNWRKILARKTEQRDALTEELQTVFTPYLLAHREQVFTEQIAALEQWEKDQEAEIKRLQKAYKPVFGGEQWEKYLIRNLEEWSEDHKKPQLKTKKDPVTGKKTYDHSAINLASSQQVKIALESIGVCVESTDSDHLEPYMHIPEVRLLAQWKKLNKFITSFGEKLLAKIGEDGRIHAEYSQVGASTGRFTCAKPNLQQIPSHEPEETNIRKCIIAAPGNVLLTFDLPNIELRILAEISKDATMLALFDAGKDLHSMTATMMFRLAEEVDPKKTELKPGLNYRAVAKTINFGLCYGMSASGLAGSLGVTLEEAEKLQATYFSTFPGVASWLETSSQLALETGYSTTLAGRKRFYPVTPEPVYNSSMRSYEDYLIIRKHWNSLAGSIKRKAKNAPIQGTNADILKYALALLYHNLPPSVRFVACVHDEVVLECSQEESEHVYKIVSACMTKACKHYLKRVAIPDIDGCIETYWKKD